MRGGEDRVVPRGLLAVLLTLGPMTAGAQEPEAVRADALDRVPVGRVIERVVSAADATQSWAAYVPTGYDPGRRWPVLFAMDPRGRALVPLERLVDPAERFGYVVLSSWNTASDFTGPDPNEPALAAMLDDAQTLFAVDGRRLYLVGFSGTARAAWTLGMRLTGHVAGIIGVGGGMPQSMYGADLSPLREHPELGFYGLAGTADFNHPEMWRLEALLDGAGVANALAFFDGPHAWAPADALARAVAWMETRAMQSGLRPVDEALVDSLHRDATARARALEEAGDLVAAWREYDTLADAHRGLRDVTTAERHATRLAATATVRDGLGRRRLLRERFWALAETLDGLLFEVRLRGRDADAGALAEAIGIEPLLAEAADSTDPVGAAAARRALEHVYVHASFYQPTTLLRQDRPDDALAMLELAERIFPGRPRICVMRAAAHAAAGSEDDALAAVRCALEAGVPPDVLRNDPGLEPLRALPAFRALTGGGSG